MGDAADLDDFAHRERHGWRLVGLLRHHPDPAPEAGGGPPAELAPADPVEPEGPDTLATEPPVGRRVGGRPFGRSTVARSVACAFVQPQTLLEVRAQLEGAPVRGPDGLG